MRAGRQPFVRRGSITGRDSLGRTQPEGQRCFSDWPLVQGIMVRSKTVGARERAGGLRTAAWNSRFEREVKFAAYFLPGGSQAAGAIGDDRVVSAERDTMRRANLP